MFQLPNYADKRQLTACVYCGGQTGTRDHVPSKVLLEAPYPENLPVVPACTECNASFSTDEEYVACLIGCVMAGDTAPEAIRNLGYVKVAKILEKKPSLTHRLKIARTMRDGHTIFEVEQERVRALVLKLARGHAAFELNEPQLDSPSVCAFAPLALLSHEERHRFEQVTGESICLWPEVGSRAMIRLVEGQDIDVNGWITVQSERYRYQATVTNGICIKMVLSEYLACEVSWGVDNN